jgi:hypothetical protein
MERNGYFQSTNFKPMYQWKRANMIGISILELLEDSSSCHATNPKDIIYSLLGLAADVCNCQLIAVYCNNGILTLIAEVYSSADTKNMRNIFMGL